MATDFSFNRLLNAIDWSAQQLEAPRASRLAAIKQYVGKHYAEGGSDWVVPVNMIELAITIYVQQLAARAPQVAITTGVDNLKSFARTMELALNQIPEEIDLGGTLQRTVLEALVGLGVCKVGLCSSGVSVLGHDAGTPFVDVVSLDDYFVDMAAKTRATIQFEGNDYWLDIESARQIYGPGLEPDDHSVEGENGETRAESVSADHGGDTFTDQIHLRDVWLPGKRVLLTYAVKTRRLLRTLPWDGPEHGPYYVLAYNDVPGNLLPLAPAALLIDLHVLANRLYRKLSKQAEGKKTVVTFPGGNDNDVAALKAAGDGDGIRYTGQKPEPITVGGIDPHTLAFYLQTKDQFNHFAGNLDLLGGLSPQSETATQDKLLAAAASARMDRMKAATLTFAKDIFKALAWYEWTDPTRRRIVQKPVEGVDFVLERVWSEETREGDFLDYNFDVDPYSMEENTPSTRLQKIGQALERFVFPMLPIIQQQGGQIDAQKLLAIVARLSNVDELREVITFGEPTPGDPQQGGDATASFKPANTTRTYERVNRPGATGPGKDDALSRILMGGGVQSSEADAIGRPTS